MAEIALPDGSHAIHHSHGAIYDEAHAADTSCEQVPACHQVPNDCPAQDCHLFGPLHHCAWNPEQVQFDCFHVHP